jgi:hypothetical protein
MRLSRASLAALIVTMGCQPPSPVAWGEPRSLPTEIAPLTTLRILGDSGVALTPGDSAVIPEAGPICAGSIRVADDGQGGQFAAWWAPRDDSNTVLVVARHAAGDGTGWTAPVVADARDRSRSGCRRPAPGIAADAARGYVHLAYYLDAPNGAGVYGGHSMESGTYFHDPVAIVYGDRPVAAAIAGSGDLIAVAYEDPNSERARIAVAISRTAGHLYEHREEASPSSMRAMNPRIATDGRRIAIAWTAEDWEQGAEGTRTMMRVGTLRPDAKIGSGGNDE